MAPEYLPPAPVIDAGTAPFWAAANEGRLLLKRCRDTGRTFHPPRSHSPFTGLANTEWTDASGAGTVYAFSVSRRQGHAHGIAYITLSEGPTILSGLTDCDLSTVRIGQSVRVVFVPSTSGQKVPMFTTDMADAPDVGRPIEPADSHS